MSRTKIIFKKLSLFLALVIALGFAYSPMAFTAEEEQACYLAFPAKMKDGVYPRQYRPERMVDYSHLKLEIQTFFDTQTVAGTVHYTFTPIHEDVTHFHLDAVEMDVEAVELSDSAAFDWTHADDVLHLQFEDPLPMQEFTLSVQYSAEPQENLWFTDPNHVDPQEPDQIYTLNEPFGGSRWFPAPDYPNDQMVTEMLVTVPNDLVTLSNGLLIESTENGEWRTDHWKQELPHVIYLVSLVVGDFEIVEQEWRGIPVTYYVTEDFVDDVIPSMGMTPDMMTYFSEYLDYPYPYEKYAQSMVRDFRAGGMEHTTATTMYEYCVIDERGLLDHDSEWLIMHELAHQWFGDLLTCESWPQLWLNEGFASYSEMMWAEHSHGYDEFLSMVQNDMNSYLWSGYTRAIVTNTFEEPMEMFDRHSYQKGAMVLHMMRMQLGDELFQKSLQTYVKQNELSLVDTDDLQEAVESATGKPMDKFFEQWVYSPGHPEVTATHEWLPDTKQVKVTLEQTQKMEEGRAAFAFPLEIDVVTSDGTTTETVEISKFEESVFIDCKEAPLSVVVDPRLKVLMKLTHEKKQPMLLHELAHGSTVIVRMRAAQALNTHKQKRVVDALATAMNNDDYYGVQEEAASTLGKVNTNEALEALLDAVDHESPYTRRAVAAALGNFYQNEDVYDALVDLYQDDESYRVIGSAANSLSNLGLEKAYSVVRGHLGEDSYREILTTSSINALANLEDSRAWSLIEKYTHDPHGRRIRTTAIRALGRVAHETETREDDTLDLLLEYLDSGSDFIRRAAVSGLRALNHEDAVPHLRRVAENDRDSGIRSQAGSAADAIVQDRGDEQVSANQKKIEEMKKKQDELERTIQSLQDTLDELQNDDENEGSEEG